MHDAIDAIRRFNRFFTRHVGAMDARFLGADASLATIRLLWEIDRRAPVLASTLQGALGLDRGHLSRLVASLERRGWITRDRTAADARARPIRLTESGASVLATTDRRQRDAVQADLDRLDPSARRDLVEALGHARHLLEPDASAATALRTLRSGDLGWIASRQARLYAETQGWGAGLEASVLRSAGDFLAGFTPGRSQGWIAELDGVPAGAVLLSDEGEGTARLRLLHVEGFARRRGIGEALVGACIAFAREAGYRDIILWTHTVLGPARRLYARAGFVQVSSEEHHVFGVPVMGETWRMDLRPQ